jgi:hypothetical protein
MCDRVRLEGVFKVKFATRPPKSTLILTFSPSGRRNFSRSGGLKPPLKRSAIWKSPLLGKDSLFFSLPLGEKDAPAPGKGKEWEWKRVGV